MGKGLRRGGCSASGGWKKLVSWVRGAGDQRTALAKLSSCLDAPGQRSEEEKIGEERGEEEESGRRGGPCTPRGRGERRAAVRDGTHINTHPHHLYIHRRPGRGGQRLRRPPGAAGGGASVPPAGGGTAGPGGARGSCRRGCLHLGLSITEPAEQQRRSGLENYLWMV